MTVHLGFDQPHLAQSEWYEDCSHPYVKAVAYLLDRLATWERVKYIEFLISPGVDPMTNLKGELARRVLKPGELPSKICSRLATQNIYRVDRALNVQNHPDL